MAHLMETELKGVTQTDHQACTVPPEAAVHAASAGSVAGTSQRLKSMARFKTAFS